MSNTTYDFGFTFEDPTETVIHVQEPYSSRTTDDDDLKDEIMAKLYDLEARLLTVDQSTLIAEHKRLVEMEVAEKLKQVEDLILPLLSSILKKNMKKKGCLSEPIVSIRPPKKKFPSTRPILY